MKELDIKNHDESGVSNKIDVDTLLADSIVRESEFDTTALQNKIIAIAEDLPQARSTQIKPWSLTQTVWGKFKLLQMAEWFSMPRLATLGGTALAVVMILPIIGQQSESPAAPLDYSEQVLLTEQELASGEFEELLWQELILLDEEIAFATL
jgi:hypothetical protein